MRNVNVNILSAVDTASQTGAKIDANQLFAASFAVYFGDASAAGTLRIQASNDPCAFGYLPDDFTPTNWVNIPNASATITSGSSAMITITGMAYRWIRAVYTRTSGGSTTIHVDMNAQSV